MLRAIASNYAHRIGCMLYFATCASTLACDSPGYTLGQRVEDTAWNGGVATVEQGGSIVPPSNGGAPSANTTRATRTSATAGAFAISANTANTGSGGTTRTSGERNIGGLTSAPGATTTTSLASGGASSLTPTGGSFLSGGTKSADGTLSTGGTVAFGTSNSGGTSSTSHMTSTGGTVAFGSTTRTSGTSNTGGTSSTGNPYCRTYTDLGALQSAATQRVALPSVAICYRFTVASTSDQFHGIQMSNCDTRTVTINGTDSGCAPGTGCSVEIPIPRASDGYWYVAFTAGATTYCTSSWWWW